MDARAEQNDAEPALSAVSASVSESGKRQRRRPRLAWALAGAASLALVGGLAAVKVTQIMAAIAYGKSFPEPAQSVVVAVAETRMIAPTAAAIGELQALNVVDLSIERAGVVREVRFASGDSVEEGQVLVQIDVSEERADLAAAEIDASRARAELGRRQELAAEGVASTARLDDARATAAAAEARVAALRAAIDRKTVRAPFAGRVGITDLKPGQYVDVGDLITRLLGLYRAINFDFALPQAAAAGVDRAEPVAVNLDGEHVPARIVAEEPAIDAASRSLSFRALIDDYDGALPAGSLVTVTAPVGPPRRSVVIPRTGVQRSPYGDTVYRLVEKNGETRAEGVVVVPGEVLGSAEIVIRSGLEAGDRIAADGVFKLRDGALVNPVSADDTSGEEAEGPVAARDAIR